MKEIRLHGKFGLVFRLSTYQFAKILELGRKYGWKSFGTLPPRQAYIWDPIKPGIFWDKGYLSAEGQSIFPKDAKNLAIALERALFNIPKMDNRMFWETFENLQAIRKLKTSEILQKLEDSDEMFLTTEGLYLLQNLEKGQYFSAKDKPFLRRFIWFCKLGGFRIGEPWDV